MADFAMHEETHPDTPRIPAWFRKEPPVAILEDSDFGLYCDDDEIGIQQTDYSKAEFVNSEAAFLFGQSPEELYFRLNFSAVIKIPCCPGPEERKIREKLYNKQRAAFRDHRGMIATTFHGIAIYKDALAMLPLEPSTESAGNASASPETAIAVDGDGEEEEGRQGELFSEPTLEIDGEIQSAIDAELVLRQGRLYGRHCMDGDSAACNFDIAFMENRLFVIVYGDAAGTWLADEDSFDESPPLWFSETTHRTSPVNQAQRCRDFIQQSIPAVTVVAMVVLGPKVYILNEDEMLTLWKEKCLVHVAQTRQDPEGQIPSLHDCLSSLPGADAAPSAQDLGALQIVAKILERNPLAWKDQTP